jgi:hypothetical protein
MTLSGSCSLNVINSVTSLDWGKFGVGFIFNLCNVAVESIVRGLQNLHPPVQIWVLPLVETSRTERFSCFYLYLELYLIGVCSG